MAGQRRYDERPKTKYPDFQKDWIEISIVGGAIEYAEKLGQRLAEENFTTSQIRNFYGELKRIQLKSIQNNKPAFHLLHPKLAYAAKRAEKSSGKGSGKGAAIFKEEILKAHQAVQIDQDRFEKRFQNFCDLCEAILAFHKAYGGKD